MTFLHRIAKPANGIHSTHAHVFASRSEMRAKADCTDDDIGKVGMCPDGFFICRSVDAGVGLWTQIDQLWGRVDYTGTTHTISAADVGMLITSSNASLQTFTLPAFADAVIDSVQSFPIMQLGAGRVRFVAGAGATVYPSDVTYLETLKQHALVHATKIGANEWLVTGDLA